MVNIGKTPVVVTFPAIWTGLKLKVGTYVADPGKYYSIIEHIVYHKYVSIKKYQQPFTLRTYHSSGISCENISK